MGNQIRKDDLDALGEMAGLVGMYMNDFASKTPPDARQKLFAGGRPDVRKTLASALVPVEDDIAQQLVPDNTNTLPATPEIKISEPVDVSPNNTTQNNYNPSMPPVPSFPTPQPKVIGEQLEFDFLDQRIKGIGSVGDIIKLFNERLDKIENDNKIILLQLKTILSNINISSKEI